MFRAEIRINGSVDVLPPSVEGLTQWGSEDGDEAGLVPGSAESAGIAVVGRPRLDRGQIDLGDVAQADSRQPGEIAAIDARNPLGSFRDCNSDSDLRHSDSGRSQSNLPRLVGVGRG